MSHSYERLNIEERVSTSSNVSNLNASHQEIKTTRTWGQFFQYKIEQVKSLGSYFPRFSLPKFSFSQWKVSDFFSYSSLFSTSKTASKKGYSSSDSLKLAEDIEITVSIQKGNELLQKAEELGLNSKGYSSQLIRSLKQAVNELEPFKSGTERKQGEEKTTKINTFNQAYQKLLGEVRFQENIQKSNKLLTQVLGSTSTSVKALMTQLERATSELETLHDIQGNHVQDTKTEAELNEKFNKAYNALFKEVQLNLPKKKK